MKHVFATELDANDSTVKEEVGILRIEPDGKIYRYILVEDADLAVGDVLEFSDTSGYEVTKAAGSSSVGNKVAGVAINVITDAYYGWIQVSGRHSAVRCDGGVAAGHMLVPHATFTGRADTSLASGTSADEVFGIALETDSTSATTTADAACMISCL